LLDIITYPNQQYLPCFAGVGNRWKDWEVDEITLWEKRILVKNLSDQSLRLSELCYTDIREWLVKWGALPVDSNPGVDWNGHIFVTLLNVQRMKVMNLTHLISNSPCLEDVIEEIDECYVPDPLVRSFRTKERERIHIKAKRIREIRKYLTEGAPSWLTEGELAYDE
jgi:hypothetical protein